MGTVAAVLGRSRPADLRAIEAMISAAPHRGPLAAKVEIGSCILAISESDLPGSTSLASGPGVAAAFTGSLDDADDLAAQLLPDGHNGSRSPADLLLAGFEKYGMDLPRHLRGIFAAVVTDGSRILCFRDHLGYAALFYRADRDACYVASEAKQVLAGAGLSKEPDLDALERILFKSYDDASACAVRGVLRLAKATALILDRESARSRRYWHPENLLETARYADQEVQDRFDHLMSQAARRCLTGEDIVSISGGVDSPAVAAYAAPHYRSLVGRPLPAISVVFPDLPAVDESRYVELVADRLGLDLHTYEQKARPLDRLQEWADLADGPVPTVALPQYVEHYRAVRALGSRNMLSGELAELVCDMPMFRFPHLVLNGRFAAIRRDVADRRARSASWGSIARSFLSTLVPTRATAMRWSRRRAGNPTWVDRRRANETAVRSIVPARDRWRNVQVNWIEGPGISIEADELCQDMCGVRMRRPWTDVDLWEFFLSLPAEVKYPDARSKTLVRRLLRGRVPDEILDRRDKTFFDDSVMRSIDYGALRRWLIDPPYRLPGVDYEALRDKLVRQELDLTDVVWAKDLASIHAFLGLW